MSMSHGIPGRAALHLARTAARAPSPHNSQPWLFVGDDHDRGFEVHADGGRRLILTDPGGRESVIACGAALFNVRHLGFRPVVDVLPEPGDPDFLARVAFGAYARVTEDESAFARAIPHRHTHRGRFGPVPVPEALLGELCDHARAEGAVLQVIDSAEKLAVLARLVRAAEDVHRGDRGHAAEIERYVGAHGVPVEACRHNPDVTLLAGRDYLGLARPLRG